MASFRSSQTSSTGGDDDCFFDAAQSPMPSRDSPPVTLSAERTAALSARVLREASATKVVGAPAPAAPSAPSADALSAALAAAKVEIEASDASPPADAADAADADAAPASPVELGISAKKRISNPLRPDGNGEGDRGGRGECRCRLCGWRRCGSARSPMSQGRSPHLFPAPGRQISRWQIFARPGKFSTIFRCRFIFFH